MSDQAGKRKAKAKAYYIKSAKQAKRSASELGPETGMFFNAT
jgi:hypothetical protein